MRDILAARQRALLEPFAWSRTLLAFDFDGTLAPIVERPEDAVMRPATRRLLTRVAALYPTVVISGRAYPDVEKRVQGLGLRAVVGNHGLEPWKATPRIHRRVREWRPLFEEALASEPGVEIEDKNYSLAIHFRRSRSKKKVRAVVAEVVRGLQKARLIGGIEVVNIVPSDAPHKGMALERERSRLSCDTAIYVGDDETDEDVFALDQPGRLLGIRVGRRPGSRAEFYLESQAGIDSLIRLLARLREDTGTLVKRLEELEAANG
ncbi:MAG TPA: trehalose-phosphatase [Vicinamibacteria bacterium]|nr:trehalose-phosphatase [Vicinamibacteria bacterium]HRB13057.1 trehalose-phosphatase [Vicinamibacteria bacterium]